MKEFTFNNFVTVFSTILLLTGDCKMVIVDCTNLTAMDYSAAEAFYHGAEALKRVEISLKLCGLSVSSICLS